jgi:LCP family protein required for cell wall assembly
VRKNKSRKKVVFVISLLLLLAGACAYAYVSGLMEKLGSDNIEAKAADIKKPVNILVLGVDAGDYANKTADNPKRSDTMMLVRYVPQREKVYMLSIPRDTRVLLNGHAQKLNAAHAIGGPSLTIKTIEEMLGVSINYYASIDYEGFRKCIDAIGGVDVVVPQDMDYDAYDISIHFKEGETVHLDGKRAEEFVRWRKNNDGSGYAMGDLDRAAAQQEFMMNILQKVKSPSMIIRVPKLVDTLSNYVKTNMNTKAMLQYGLKLKNVKVSQVEKEILKGEPKYIGGVSYYIWDKDKNNDFLRNFRDTDEAESDSLVNVDRSKVKVAIYNSTGVKGLAGRYKEKLQEQGYEVVKIANYTKKLDATLINDYSSENYGNTVYDDLQFGKVVEKSGGDTNANVVVILGKDSVK